MGYIMGYNWKYLSDRLGKNYGIYWVKTTDTLGKTMVYSDKIKRYIRLKLWDILGKTYGYIGRNYGICFAKTMGYIRKSMGYIQKNYGVYYGIYGLKIWDILG